MFVAAEERALLNLAPISISVFEAALSVAREAARSLATSDQFNDAAAAHPWHSSAASAVAVWLAVAVARPWNSPPHSPPSGALMVSTKVLVSSEVTVLTLHGRVLVVVAAAVQC